ncbi:conserved hypothetical protein [Ricinus communis]|uniref:Uncharacterized protein n=1 Tax=Ricinus communis TaxID=3988 RepID=B9T7J8_RICCO|nr:conserved hypothetical protein [Ricinus communis]
MTGPAVRKLLPTAAKFIERTIDKAAEWLAKSRAMAKVQVAPEVGWLTLLLQPTHLNPLLYYHKSYRNLNL